MAKQEMFTREHMADYQVDGQDSNFHTNSKRTKLLWAFEKGNVMEKKEMFDMYVKV